MVLDEIGKCDICNKITCLSCYKDKTKEKNHICKEEDIHNVKESRKISKFCPSCKQIIILKL